MVVTILIPLVIAWAVGIVIIIITILGRLADSLRPNTELKTNIPYYVDDEINAIYELIEVNSKTIEELDILLSITTKHDDQLKIRKKIADIQLKNAKLENKVNKLLDKWEI